MKNLHLLTAAVAGILSASTLAPELALGAPAVKKSKADELGQCVGANSCKGQSRCMTSDGSNSCKGMNSCKGKGWVAMTKAECDRAAKSKENKGRKIHFEAGLGPMG